jgi:acyl-CoA synthetase (AMP-forming)/AMP-acid ligase II
MGGSIGAAVTASVPAICRVAAHGKSTAPPRQAAIEAAAAADHAHSHWQRREARVPAFRRRARHGGERHRAQLAALAPKLQFDDPINIQFTSSTTGAPKGATLAHHNVLKNGYFIGEAMRLTDRDRICIPVPLYHCFGMVPGNLACITQGAAIGYPSEGFDPLATLQAVEAERCTALYGVATMFIAELGHPDSSSASISPRYAPASWPARPARSK